MATSALDQSYNQADTPTQDVEVKEITIEPDRKKKKPELAKTASLQMMKNHTVEERLLEELWFGKFITECPFLLCFIIMIVLFLIIFIDSAYFVLSDHSTRTFLVEGDKYVEAYDSYHLAAQFIADNAVNNATILPQTQTDDFWLYQHMYMLKDYTKITDDTDYWILTPENIETIIKYENMIVHDNYWKNRFCYAGPNPLNTNYSCVPAIQSAARMIYNDANYSSMTTEDIRDWVYDRIDSISFFFNPGVQETGQSYIYRSFFAAGLPIATQHDIINGTNIHYTTYKNPLDNEIEQEQDYIEWASKLWKDITVDHNGELTDGDLKILTVSWIVYDDYFGVLLNGSMVYLIFSIIIVLVYMSIHLSSIFLAICALFQILMSFPLAFFFYRLVFGITHYDTLSSLIIFVLLGVGADDVFVFTDAWFQSIHFIGKHKHLQTTIYKSKCSCCSSYCNCVDHNRQLNILRMSFTFRRASKAMFVTQITTFFAFLATATSSIMPISGFGIWAATIVAMNYILVITLYPAILIIHHKYLKKYESLCLCFLCSLCKKNKKNNNDASVNNTNSNNNNNNEMRFGDIGDSGDMDMMPEISRQLSEDIGNTGGEEYRCFETFLGRKWWKLIIQFKWCTLIFFGLLFIGAAIIGSQMEAQSEDEKWFADEHFMQKAQDRASQFSASETDNLVQLLITFGIEGVDRAGSSRWDPENFGSVIWDETFSMSSTKAQEYLLKLCYDTRNSSLVYPSELLTTGNSSVTCPIEDFQNYLQSIGETFPYKHTESFGETYSDFLNSDYGAKSSALTFVDKLDDYAVRFYAMDIYTAMTWSETSDVSRDERAKWDEYISDFNSDCPDSLCNSVQNVALRWCWLVTQQAFVRSAIQGVVIAMPIAFIILLLSTQNWIISIFAVFDIIGIMLCELSIMQFMGWKFGVSECVAIVIIIGFSVDYVVHLANAYLESSQTTREERLSFALLTMGISVCSGAVTTFASGLFLIFPAIVFFYKMGILMISTVAMSIFWAMCFFTSICAVAGPENNTGDLKQYFRCCPCYKNKKNKNKNENEIENKNKTGSGAGRKETYQNYTVDDGEIKPYEIEMEENQIEIR